MTHAIIPVKNVEDAKQRLSPGLTPDERRTLFVAMIEDVVEAISTTPEIEHALMITLDPIARDIATRYGLEVVAEPSNRGQTPAVNFAATTLIGRGVQTMLAVPADIPLVTADELSRLIAAHETAPAITIGPARDELGSNAVLCSPPDALPFRFGSNSFFPHVEKARSLGIEPTIVKAPGYGLDIDTPEDLWVLAQTEGKSRAHAYLEWSGLTQRLASRYASHS